MTTSDLGLSALKGRRLLVTGGAGMLGSTICRMAAAAGAKVTAVDNLAPLYGGNRFNLAGLEKSARFVKGDIRDRTLIETLVRGQDAIFNLAAQVSYVDSNMDPFLDLDINCRGHLIVLEACRKLNRTARLIFASSRFVYGSVIKKECRCTPEREKELNQAVDFVCLQQHSCDDVNTVLCIFPAFKESICNDLQRRTLLFGQCIEAREQLRDECYPDETTPGGKTHKQRIDEEIKGREKCLAKQALCGCGT